MRKWIGAVFLLGGCGGEVAPRALTVDHYLERGPSRVGYRVSEATWTTPEGTRSLRLAVWYPTDDPPGSPFEYRDLFEAADVTLDAVPAGRDHPVVVFSHGHLAYGEAASFLAVHLASHGRVVVAPDHTDNTTFDGPERTTAIYWQRPLDLGAVLDHLAELPAADPLAGRVDTADPLLVGHSFGGYGALAAAGARFDRAAIDAGCAADPADPICSDWAAWRDRFAEPLAEPRFAGFVPMAAGDFGRFGAAGVGEVTGPVLQMTAGLDTGADNDPYWDALPAGSRRVHLPAAAHNTFTDFSGILDAQEGLLDPEVGFRVIGAYVLAFDDALDGGALAGRIVDGLEPVDPAAEVLRR